MTRHDPNRGDRILLFIDGWTRDHGYPPTVREIMHGVGLRSPAAVTYHLSTLKRAGLLQHDPMRSRSVRLAQDPGVCGSCGRGW